VSDSGQLEKLLIKAFEAPDCSGEPVAVFTAYVNPAEITLGYEFEWDAAQGSGTTGSRMNFKKSKPGDLSLAFFIDGTGANGHKVDVQEQVALFQTVTGYNGRIHRPNHLKLTWGTLAVRRCVLKSASIAYKLFKPDGVPLRAVVTASFADASDDQTRVAIAQDESPDLTHLRTVRAGDTLPALCQQIYGDPALAPLVARANDLDSPRLLTPGQRLRFPPLQR
jgi:LysM repeat protein